jgi:hypothetical protein
MQAFIRAIAATLICIPFGAAAQFALPKIPGLGNVLGGSDMSGQSDALVRNYVAANKDVLMANFHMADALGLKEAAATSKATADALGDGATKGTLEEANKTVSDTSGAVAAEMAKHPKLDAAAKTKFQQGLVKLVQGVVKYRGLRKPAADFAAGISNASPLQIPKLQSGVYVASTAPTSISNAATALNNVIAFAKSNDIPVPADATSALSAL